MREFISSDITCCIQEQTPVIFGTIKEGIVELLVDHLGYFRSKMVALIGVRSLTFMGFRACGALD